jgi:hypothetical protein
MGHQPPLAYRHYDLFFTPRLMPQLRNLRNAAWAKLIDRLTTLPETHPDALAFAMMMIDLGNCLACKRDCYRAQRGCARCARHTIITFKGSDQQLLNQYEQARQSMLERLSECELEQAV